MIAASGFEAILDGGGIFPDDADIEHGGETLTGDGVRNQREFSPTVRLLDWDEVKIWKFPSDHACGSATRLRSGLQATAPKQRLGHANMEGNAKSSEAMEEMGRAAAVQVSAGTVIALSGTLGVGKTHWTKGFVAGLGSRAEVISPTFGLVHEYLDGRLPVFHFDFYRLQSAEELLGIGWDEYLESSGVIVAEWGDRFPEILPKDAILIEIKVEADGSRSLTRKKS